MPPAIRKLVSQREETVREAGRPVEPPARKVVVAAVIANPCAGRFVADLAPLYDLGAEVAAVLAERAVAALGVGPEAVSAYGKAAIVGTDGELEHAAAILHPRFGAPVRAAVGHGDDIIPSTKKVGGAGAAIVMPVTNKDDTGSSTTWTRPRSRSRTRPVRTRSSCASRSRPAGGRCTARRRPARCSRRPGFYLSQKWL